jgi:diguanylate cyclase (GGDEF)-like protein
VAETTAVRRFTRAERAQFDRLCRLCTLVVQSVELARRGDHRNRQLLELLGSARALATSRHVWHAVEDVRAQAVALLPGALPRADVLLRQDDGSFARVVSADGGGAEPVSYEPCRLDALASQAIIQRLPQQAPLAGGRRRLVMPLASGERALGCLDTTTEIARSLSADEVQMIELLAAQAAVALAGVRDRRALEQRSATDPETGLYSTWYFYERLYSETARARRYGQPVSLILATVDSYESVVANRGGAARGKILTALARVVRSSLRDKVDVACRWHEDGFAILLPSTPGLEAGAGLVAERVRHTVADMHVHDDDLGDLGRCTLSLGVAAYPRDAEDADELLVAAREALRQASAGGGNRVQARA